MADYYTNFSFIVPLNDDAQKQYAIQLSNQARTSRYEETPLPASFPEALEDVLEDWLFEVEVSKDGIWLHSGSGGIDAVCAFVQHLLQKFDTTAYVTFEWSNDCSKPRTDAYGGGAAVITKHEIETMNTAEWIRSKTT